MEYNKDLLSTLEDRFDKVQAYLFRAFDGEDDLYSFIASIMYNKDYGECCEWKNGKPNKQGKELRDRVKQFLIPIVEECGGISENSIIDEPYIMNTPEGNLPVKEGDVNGIQD